MASPAEPPVVTREDLLGRLSEATAVTLVAAPPGSGKTVLLRSWAAAAGPVAWVSVERAERDAQAFWHAVVDALRDTFGDRVFVERLDAAPTFDGDALVDRLCSALRALEEPAVLVIDDVHELHAVEALAQLERLLARRPPMLRVVLASRHDPRLGLHRLRLSGELTEIRGADLRFTEDGIRRLLEQSGVSLSDRSIALAHARTEGWAAGVRLLALSLGATADPERFVAEFSGSERTVAEYLIAEVLEQQPVEVRRMLLRTSVLDRVNGPLADLLTGVPGSGAILHELEERNAFVSALDPARTWFRYHALFADLLRLELRRSEPAAIADVHVLAAGWLARNGEVLAAIRHAQAAEDWALVSDLLSEHSFGLALDGHGASIDAVLEAVPTEVLPALPELARVCGGHTAWVGSADAAARYLAIAEEHADAVPEERRPRERVMLALVRMTLARRRGETAAVLEHARLLLDPGEAEPGLAGRVGDDQRAVALVLAGSVAVLSGGARLGERYLQEALELSRLADRPWLESFCLGNLALALARRSLGRSRELALECIALSEAHGWEQGRAAGTAAAALALSSAWRADLDDADEWLARSEHILGSDVEPGLSLMLGVVRGMLLVARGDHARAAAGFRVAADLQRRLADPQFLGGAAMQLLAQSLIAVGDRAAAEAVLADMPEGSDEPPPLRIGQAALAMAAGDHDRAIALAGPVLDPAEGISPPFRIQAHLLTALARDALDDTAGARREVEGALAAAEPEGLLWPFLAMPVRGLIERHPGHATAHGALLQEVAGLLAGAPRHLPSAAPQALESPLSDGELRVLRLLPTNLSAPEIGAELLVSANTVKTHMRHIYGKLGVHRRTDAVDRARELGLLSPTARRR